MVHDNGVCPQILQSTGLAEQIDRAGAQQIEVLECLGETRLEPRKPDACKLSAPRDSCCVSFTSSGNGLKSCV